MRHQVFRNTTQSDMLGDPKATVDVLQQALEFDNRVRFISVVNDMGIPLASAIRNGIASLEPPELTMKQQVHSVLTVCLAEEFDEYFGQTNYILVHREKLQLIFFAVSERVYVAASVEPDFPVARISDFVVRVKKIIQA